MTVVVTHQKQAVGVARKQTLLVVLTHKEQAVGVAREQTLMVVVTHQEQAVGVAGAGQVEAAAAGGDMAAQGGALAAALLALQAAAPPDLGRQPLQPPICLMHLPCHTTLPVCTTSVPYLYLSVPYLYVCNMSVPSVPYLYLSVPYLYICNITVPYICVPYRPGCLLIVIGAWTSTSVKASVTTMLGVPSAEYNLSKVLMVLHIEETFIKNSAQFLDIIRNATQGCPLWTHRGQSIVKYAISWM